jgi:hypothetical protein
MYVCIYASFLCGKYILQWVHKVVHTGMAQTVYLLQNGPYKIKMACINKRTHLTCIGTPLQSVSDTSMKRRNKRTPILKRSIHFFFSFSSRSYGKQTTSRPPNFLMSLLVHSSLLEKYCS